ncbi:envelope glycoprotein 150 [Vespertilionid gammaherpesvirus 1]|uniref:Envelope glycoprotein 150 n=1 Tax=Vespertilionid gammaherpesvirus 1 TaxID=2560830 RepID=A0A0X9Y7F9_9GAMA|nr:envelope glycoprotein 150 [Myotis gammaherpesvirus 8]AMA67384.1 envelope glycoprotein 150 [Vespertilionid gammaherpesvirus 1]
MLLNKKLRLVLLVCGGLFLHIEKSDGVTTQPQPEATKKDPYVIFLWTVGLFIIALIIVILTVVAIQHIKEWCIRRRYGVTAIYRAVEAECKIKNKKAEPSQSIYMPD